MFLTLLVLFFCWSTPVEPVCSPVEEGQQTNLSKVVNTNSCSSQGLVSWRAGGSEVAQCVTLGCAARYSVLSVDLSSTLTISSVSRTDPFNMETRWAISPCGGDPITVCDRLQVYALPENPSCTVREEPDSGDTRSVTVSCSTSKVYPRAECRFYSKTDNGDSVQINNQITYSHPEISGTPVYYRSECSVTVEVKDLGEGTHRFTGYIYPGVTGGYTLVGGSDGDKTVTLSFPQASHSCDPQMVQGYFTEESSTCTCSLSSVGYPRGTAQWYQGDQRVGSGGILVVTHDRASSDQKTYTCEGESSLGRKTGSTLTQNFAFLYKDSVVVESTSDTINICDNNNNNYQVQVTCRISKENVNPAPSFSFSHDGATYDVPQSGTVSGDGGSYQRQTSLSPDAGGGKYQVFCRVTNTVTNTRDFADTFITFQ
ncbi:hypothetical protein EGW08_017884, partial [Elysia chlorotica]